MLCKNNNFQCSMNWHRLGTSAGPSRPTRHKGGRLWGNPFGSSLRSQFSNVACVGVEGKGYVAVVGRVGCRRGLSVEWMILGTFPVMEMENTSIPIELRGPILSIGSHTTLQGRPMGGGFALPTKGASNDAADTCIWTTKASAFGSRDWNVLCLKSEARPPREGVRWLPKEACGGPRG